MTGQSLKRKKIDKSISLYGNDKVTGKPNPSSVKGFYVGYELRDSKFSEKPNYAWILQTAEGRVRVFSATYLDYAMNDAREEGALLPGQLIEIQYLGKEKSKTVGMGDHHAFDVVGFAGQTDPTITTELQVSYRAQDKALAARPAATVREVAFDDDLEESDVDGDAQAMDEVAPAYRAPVAPKQAATVTKSNVGSARALLNKSKVSA